MDYNRKGGEIKEERKGREEREERWRTGKKMIKKRGKWKRN